MFGLSLTAIKFIAAGIVVAAIIAVAVAYRHELIEKGKNIVYAEDNAARVKAQEKQIADDAQRVEDLQEQARKLSAQGRQVKVELRDQIKYVQTTCPKDGAGDPRLKQFNDWLLTRPPYDSRSTGDRRTPETAVPKAR